MLTVPRQRRAQDEVAGRVRAVAQRAAGQRDALAEPDQPAARARAAAAAARRGDADRRGG